ncbi:MAG TPA: phosphoribosylglycinamide formyltransferase [Moraxellaceae bacterium]|nr:phosphoribosylglycinamide formyltransferase [Moraxellaceae bacterium]
MLKIAVLISGSGSNLQAIIDAMTRGEIDVRIAGVLSNRPDAYGLTRARQHGIATAVIAQGEYSDRAAFDQALIRQIDAWGVDIVVLAGFMRILTPEFVTHFEGRLLNIHPSLLPRHKGLHTHRRALEAGDTEHGCSVHYVTAELDGGPVVAQAQVPVHPDDSEATLTARVHEAEHRLYPRVLGWLASGDLEYRGGRPHFRGQPLTVPLPLDSGS